MAENFHVVWRTQPGKQTDFEFEYLHEVLLGATPHRADLSGGPAESGALIVYSCDRPDVDPKQASFIRSVPNHSLLHLSNETLNHHAGYYREARVVLRSLYDPEIAMPNVLAVPLGFKSGFLKREPVTFEKPRRLVWCFAGQMKKYRRPMEEAFREVRPFHLHSTSGWDSKDGLTTQQMRDLYAETVFAPCPFGNIHPDSFRIMEALEHGCIPVSIRFLDTDYFRYTFGNHPFIIAPSWAEAARTIRDLAANPERLRQMQESAHSWYIRFKTDLAEDVHRALSGQLDQLVSPQFAMQHQGHSDYGLRLRCRLHFYARPLVRKYVTRAKRLVRS